MGTTYICTVYGYSSGKTNNGDYAKRELLCKLHTILRDGFTCIFSYSQLYLKGKRKVCPVVQSASPVQWLYTTISISIAYAIVLVESLKYGFTVQDIIILDCMYARL